MDYFNSTINITNWFHTRLWITIRTTKSHARIKNVQMTKKKKSNVHPKLVNHSVFALFHFSMLIRRIVSSWVSKWAMFKLHYVSQFCVSEWILAQIMAKRENKNIKWLFIFFAVMRIASMCLFIHHHTSVFPRQSRERTHAKPNDKKIINVVFDRAASSNIIVDTRWTEQKYGLIV